MAAALEWKVLRKDSIAVDGEALKVRPAIVTRAFGMLLLLCIN